MKKKPFPADLPRCSWAAGSALETVYHDEEWGTPLHDDRRLFEFVILEGAQAGLSWRTVLQKRENYRKALHDFDIAKLAKLRDADLDKLLENPGLIRNRLKIHSIRKNALAAQRVIAEHGSLDDYLWSFVGGKPLRRRPQTREDVPARTEVSDRMSKALQKAGFTFVGSTICYALMQATGMVDDHVSTCWRARNG